MMYIYMLILSLIAATQFSSSQKHGDIRLSGYGSSSLAGRLEIYFNGKWGTVCGDIKFDLLTASVACRQLSLGPAVSVTYYPDLRYGIGDDDINIEELVCTGVESHILRCHYKPVSQLSKCQHHHDVGIICSAALLPYFGSLRLSTTNSTSNGLLQLYAYGEWRPVCYTGMSIQAVNTSCKQMGYTSALEYTKSDSDSVMSTWTLSVTCDNNDYCLSTCVNSLSLNEINDNECTFGVLVQCTFDPNEVKSSISGNKSACELPAPTPFADDVRMTSLSDDGAQGIPEVYAGDQWHKICKDSSFTLLSGDVLCKQLGYSAAVRFLTASQLGTESSVQLTCTGLENAVKDCEPVVITTECIESVELRCNNEVPTYGSLKLFNGSGSAGALYVFDGTGFHPICDNGFGTNELTVACQQLGYNTGIQVVNNSLYGLSTRTESLNFYAFKCSGDEEYLMGCETTELSNSACRYPYDTVSIQCGMGRDSDLRLASGNTTSGLLQVNIDNQWGTVCGLEFDHFDAHVACREMGFQTFSSFYFSEMSILSVPIHLTSIRCHGFESDLLSCPHEVDDNGTCQHKHDVYLHCSDSYPVPDGKIHLVGDLMTPYSGRLEISFHGLWMSMCGIFFDEGAANTACRQLGYTNVESFCTNACNGSSDGYIFFSESHCQGDERELIECEIENHNSDLCTHQNDVGLTCSNKRNTVSPTSTLTPSSSLLSSSLSSNVLEPTLEDIEPTPSFFLPIPKIAFYCAIGGVVLILLLLVALVLFCCMCGVYNKQRRWREREEMSSHRRDEIDMPRAANPTFINTTPPQSSEDTSFVDLNHSPWKEAESKSFDNEHTDIIIHNGLEGVNGTTLKIVSPTKLSNSNEYFEEVDFGLEEPPRYDEIEFKSLPRGAARNGIVAMETINATHVSNGATALSRDEMDEKRELELSSLKRGDL